ncbi:hypothetical protein OA253_00415 [Alphaproteobacteria bacterium]|nr:hypothetical protein [Alphaproteobacteria bacterium]
MECFVHADKKYFPEYNWFEKAINYPYRAPTTSFTFKNGKFYQGIHISLKNRVPIISIGSNRSPYQLENKFGMKENLCVTPAKLCNSVIVYAASMSSYGSIPATQWPCEGSVSFLNLLWLNQNQLQIMHLSEGLGIDYNYVELDKDTVILQEEDYSGPIFGYISMKGGYLFDGISPLRLKNIKSNTNTFLSVNEYEALNKLFLENPGCHTSLESWLKKMISDKSKRLLLINKMAKKSFLPKNVPWKILDLKVTGNNIY